MSEEEIIEIIRTRLSIRVKTSESYNGGMDGGSMYDKVSSVQLLLDGEVISEDYC